MSNSFDLIGDIHGYADELGLLLGKLGYKLDDGVYRHSERRVIFIGDFIDRGPKQRETMNIVMSMVQHGSALSVMGNHEFNAVAWNTPNQNGDGYLRAHTEDNTRGHKAFIDAYAGREEEKKAVLGFFNSLPLWLELDGLRAIHACWDDGEIAKLKPKLLPGNCLSDELLISSSIYGSEDFTSIETLIKGKELRLPNGQSFLDSGGKRRTNMRVQWWKNNASTYADLAFVGQPGTDLFGGLQLANEIQYGYHETAKPVFVGHYWLSGQPSLQAHNVCCLDYSVAKDVPDGDSKLTAYRWDGERELDNGKFESIIKV